MPHSIVTDFGTETPVGAVAPLDVRRKHGVNLLGVVHNGEEVWAPTSQQLVGPGTKGLVLRRYTGVLLQDEDLEEIANLL